MKYFHEKKRSEADLIAADITSDLKADFISYFMVR